MNFSKMSVSILILAVISLTGCMKTRSQLRQEGSAPESSVSSDEQTSAPGKPSGYQMEEIRTELTRISGKTEELEHKLQGHNITAIQEAVSRLKVQMDDIEKNQVLVMSELKDLKDLQSAKAAEEDEKVNIKSKPKDTLARAFQLLEDEKAEEAYSLFHKASEAGLAKKEKSEAYFGMGSALFKQKEYRKAIVDLSKVQEINSKSARIPAALLLIGKSFDKLNMKKEAAGFYQELSEKYPTSPEAKKIKSKSHSH